MTFTVVVKRNCIIKATINLDIDLQPRAGEGEGAKIGREEEGLVGGGVGGVKGGRVGTSIENLISSV